MKLLMLLMMAVDGAAGSAPDVQLLDFSASYCGPCQQMVPILQRMEHAGFPIRQIDITNEPELAKRFKVERIPTFVLMVEGKEIERFVGLRSEAELRQVMNKAASDLALRKADAAVEAKPQFVSVETKTDVPPGESKAEDKKSAKQDDVARVPEKRSLGDMFRRLIGKSDASPETADLRGQDPASNAVSQSDASEKALAATVRIRVAGKSTEDETYLQDVGTGTIVHSVIGQAVVLTCAHLFLNISVKDAVVEVEIFEDGKAVTYPAKLIGGDHDADLALLRIQTSKMFPAVRLSEKITEAKPGQELFTFGCNDGSDPTRLNTKLVEINRYHGPPNFVCTVDPVSGRSGGGLFSSDGELLGVCSCADRKTHEGLYAAHGAILELVNHCNIKEILNSAAHSGGEDPSEAFKEQLTKPNSPTPKMKPAVAKSPSPTTSKVDADDDGDFVEVSPDSFIELPETTPAVLASGGQAPVQPSVETTGPEITIVIDDKIPGSTKKVIVIPKASAWMLEMLTGEAADAESAVTTALRPVNSIHSISRKR